MRRVTIEQEIEDEVKRMIFEQGNDGEQPQAHSPHPQWDGMKDAIGGSVMSFASGFLDLLVGMFVVVIVIVGIVLAIMFL